LNHVLDVHYPGQEDLRQGLLDGLQLIAKDYGYKWAKCLTRMEATED
jgi:hypothetical protein